MSIRKKLLKDGIGCTDGHCVLVGKSTGQHTNGGCHCLGRVSLQERRNITLSLYAWQAEVARLQFLLDE